MLNILESISFERGKDPKETLGIGNDSINKQKANHALQNLEKIAMTTTSKMEIAIIRILDLISDGLTADEAIDSYSKSVLDLETKDSESGMNLDKRFYVRLLEILIEEIGLILSKDKEKLTTNMEEYGKFIKEDAMGGVSAPMSTLNNTPGMGNAVPGSAATNMIGSGDKWGNTVNKKPYTQSNPIKRKKKKKIVRENNINPNDKIGVAMAKKMRVPMTFTKGNTKKNQNAVKQKKFEHQIITLDDYMKKLNENNK